MTPVIEESPMEFGLKKVAMYSRMFGVFGVTTAFPLLALLRDAGKKDLNLLSSKYLVLLVCLLIPIWVWGVAIVLDFKKYRLKIFKDRISLTRSGFSEVLEISEIERFQVITLRVYIRRFPPYVSFIPRQGLNKETIIIGSDCEGFEAVQIWARNAGIKES
jgi:hypothetical protein